MTLASASFLLMAACRVSTTANPAAMVVVPDRMRLTGPMRAAQWEDTRLVPIDVTAVVGVMEGPALSGKDAIAMHSGPEGGIAFVVRRPG